MICPFCLKAIPTGSGICPGCSSNLTSDMIPPYAGLFRRLVAIFLDVFLINLIFIILFLPLSFIFQDSMNEYMILAIAIPSAAVSFFALLQLIMLLVSGQTIGKKMLKIKIIKQNYQKAGVGTILLREIIGRFLCGITLNIGYLMALFNQRKMGLHDKVAGTIVVQKVKRGQPVQVQPEFRPAMQEAPPPYPAPEPMAAPVASQPVPEAQPPSAVSPHPPAPPEPPAPAPPPDAAIPPESVPPLFDQPAPDKHPEPSPPSEQPLSSPLFDETVPPLFDEPPAPMPEPSPPDAQPPSPPPPPYDTETQPSELPVDHVEKYCPVCKSPLEIQSPDKCMVCGYDFARAAEKDFSAEATSEGGEPTIVVSAPELITYSSEGQEERYTLQLPITKIGRLKDNHLSFPSEKAISSHHCVIYLEKNQFHIRDLNSTNGIYINNRKVEESPLADGDKIKLGFKVFKFKM